MGRSFISFLLVSLLAFFCAGAAQPPFWKAKPEVYRKILDERAVVVAAHRVDESQGQMTFEVKGGWLVSAPRNFVLKTVSDYSSLSTVSEIFKEVKWDPARNELSFIIDALGYKEKLVLQITHVAVANRDDLQFVVTEGKFKGLKGASGLEDQSFGKTEMSIDASFTTGDPPLPKSFMPFAMEVVTQKVAERLRAYVEKKYATPDKTKL